MKDRRDECRGRHGGRGVRRRTLPHVAARHEQGSWADLPRLAARRCAPEVGYVVYRSEQSGTGYAALNDAPIIDSTNYLDESAVDGTTYYYVVRALAPQQSRATSNEVSAVAGTCSDTALLSWRQAIQTTSPMGRTATARSAPLVSRAELRGALFSQDMYTKPPAFPGVSDGQHVRRCFLGSEDVNRLATLLAAFIHATRSSSRRTRVRWPLFGA